ncbi:3acbb351-18c6-4d0c-be3c-933b9f4fdce6 [Thermothielavioides terrestris]|uniref:Uncharacterized protein n=2 Tax=Thermothielavioides terrestris TaxID=2587410 RepID=G2RCP2_THETT|nr:uncharacterized protein THITE_2122274 [Thermothielavioides terrestris NRRL 8126]AEO70638.1 hypothetical protein THITE_2122274 [Thermothielavioides terrestris NRRL 8126]SPQ18457.1 3acbb351-18c6-4d0c-be3c-933b9f4fdce6 [Thermothielavioides terrestris]
MGDTSPNKSASPNWSDSSSGSSLEPTIHSPVPARQQLPSRKSSGTVIEPRDSSAVGPIELQVGPDDAGSMSPRRTSEDIQTLSKEAREELQRHAKALQESLINLFNRIEAVKEEHDKLDSHNKFLQKYIGDLMSTSRITSSSSRNKK